MGESPRREDPGCLVVFAIVGAELVFVGWFLGQFLLRPDRCGEPGCATLRAALTLSVISAVVGLGCVVVLGVATAGTLRLPPTLLLVAATGAFAIAAVAGVKAGLIILPLFDVMLMLVPPGLLLANELTPGETARQNTRRGYLTWALGGLTLVFAFAVVISLIVLK